MMNIFVEIFLEEVTKDRNLEEERLKRRIYTEYFVKSLIC